MHTVLTYNGFQFRAPGGGWTVTEIEHLIARELADSSLTFLDTYNFAKRLKSLRGLTPYERICQLWTEHRNASQSIHSTTCRD